MINYHEELTAQAYTAIREIKELAKDLPDMDVLRKELEKQVIEEVKQQVKDAIEESLFYIEGENIRIYAEIEHEDEIISFETRDSLDNIAEDPIDDLGEEEEERKSRLELSASALERAAKKIRAAIPV